MELSKILICPNCGSPLDFSDDRRALHCSGKNGRVHCFDLAASGYVNLLAPGKMNNAKTGDESAMVKARSQFLNLNLYEPIAESLASFIESGDFSSNNYLKSDFLKKNFSEKRLILDAGCGEGYYDLFLADKIANCEIIGFDASKFAVAHASKQAKKRSFQEKMFFAAANIFDMPVQSECADAVISLFAPISENESRRILKNNGCLFAVIAGERHLYEFKAALYSKPVLNETRRPEIEGFLLKDEIEVEYMAVLPSKEAIMNLLTMTPYYYKCSPADKERLLSNDTLETTVHVRIIKYSKL